MGNLILDFLSYGLIIVGLAMVAYGYLKTSSVIGQDELDKALKELALEQQGWKEFSEGYMGDLPKEVNQTLENRQFSVKEEVFAPVASETVGDRFRKMRQRAGLEQAQVAEVVNLTPAFVSNLERSRGSMYPSTRKAVEKLCDHYGWDKEYVLEPHDGPLKETIGGRLRLCRLKSGLSQTTVSDVVGRAAQWLKEVEKNRYKAVPLDEIWEICKKFDFNYWWILKGDRSPMTGEKESAA